MIIQALENGQKVLSDMGEATKDGIDEVFISLLEDHLKKNGDKYKPVITKQSAEKSITLINYFLQHKRNLAGYIDVTDVKPNALYVLLVKKILLYQGKVIKCQEIARCSRYPSEVIKNHMHELSVMGLGLVNTDKPACGGRASVVFQKVDTLDIDIEQTMQLTEGLNTFGIKLEDYESSLCDKENVLCPSKKQKMNE